MTIQARLIRVGIEASTDLGNFSSWKMDADHWEWIPFLGNGYRTYDKIVGHSGKSLSNYLPKDYSGAPCHYDPDFLIQPCTYGDTPGWGSANSKIKFALKMPKHSIVGFYAPFWNPSVVQRQGFPEEIYDEDFDTVSTEIFGFIEVEKIILISSSDDVQASRFGINAGVFSRRQQEGFLEVHDASARSSLFAKYPNTHLEESLFPRGAGHLIIIGTPNSGYLNKLIPLGQRLPFTNKAGIEQHRDYLLDEMAELLKMSRNLDLTQAGAPRVIGNPEVFKSLLEKNR